MRKSIEENNNQQQDSPTDKENDNLTNTQSKHASNSDEDRFKCARIVMIDEPPKASLCDDAPYVYITFNHPLSRKPITKHLKSNDISSSGLEKPIILWQSANQQHSDPVPLHLRELLKKSVF